MTPTVIAIIVGVVLLLGFVAFLFVGGIVAAVVMRRRPRALPSHRWRAIRCDLDKKFAQKQLDDDYETIVQFSGYEVTG